MLDEFLHHIVGIRLVAEQILSAQQHLQLGIGHRGADFTQPLPRIFVQIAQAGVKGGASPALHRIVTGLVHGFEDSFKVRIGHPCSNQRLLRVSKDRLGNSNLLHG